MGGYHLFLIRKNHLAIRQCFANLQRNKNSPDYPASMWEDPGWVNPMSGFEEADSLIRRPIHSYTPKEIVAYAKEVFSDPINFNIMKVEFLLDIASSLVRLDHWAKNPIDEISNG